jgi:hypothetical protein
MFFKVLSTGYFFDFCPNFSKKKLKYYKKFCKDFWANFKKISRKLKYSKKKSLYRKLIKNI